MKKSTKSWIMIAGAACFEVVWVIGLKHASAPWEWAVTAVAILISFYALIWASGRLPVGDGLCCICRTWNRGYRSGGRSSIR